MSVTKLIILLVIFMTVLMLFVVRVVKDNPVEDKKENARKNLIERQDRDIDLDGEEH